MIASFLSSPRLARWRAIGRTSALALALIPALRAAAPLAPVPTVDLAALKPSAFADNELDLPFYLAHFAELANSIKDTDPDRGAITLAVWRGNANLFNARVMENILTLAWFYCADRPWNPYYANPALRARLEAALTHWSNLQLPDGRFTESGPGVPDLAATAFATKFMGEGLILLHQGPPIAPDILARADETDRKAIMATLTNVELYEYAKLFSNQYGNVWPGGLSYLQIHPDTSLRALWEKRFRQSGPDFQSPAGYYYEAGGPDFGYTMVTHGANTRQAWSWLKGTEFGADIISRDTRWFHWLALNALPEPGSSLFILNEAIATRQQHEAFQHYDTPLGESIPFVRAFAESIEERKARHQKERRRLEAEWPHTADLVLGRFDSISPYVFLDRRLHDWAPTTEQRNAARALLPEFASENFAVQTHDSKQDAVFSFVRRPAYYAAFASGKKITSQEHFGLGLLWTPSLGTVFQNQSGETRQTGPLLKPVRDAWGTVAKGEKLSYEGQGMEATFTVAGAAVPAASPGEAQLPAGEVVASYALGKVGSKTVTFGEQDCRVEVQHPGAFTEQLPLMVPKGVTLAQVPGEIGFSTAAGKFTIKFDPSVQVAILPARGQRAEIEFLPGVEAVAVGKSGRAATPNSIGTKLVTVVTLSAQDKLAYRLEFSP